jgi:hypothetical protein
MSPEQEGALYEFLENVTEPFTLENIASFVRMLTPRRIPYLTQEIRDFINSKNIAFKNGQDRWVSRRGFFESIPFVISPTRLELLNGILIPGHRCIPFANPSLLLHEYTFYWKGKPIPWGTTEGPPDDFYPYYTIFGEEYAPQYVAQDNPENESAYNSDPYEDPAEVSIHTLDMRNIYLETAFVPGDRFVVKTRDWKAGVFDLTRVEKDEWPAEELETWRDAAEAGFTASFEYLGPGSSTDEQIAYAFWFGGQRMQKVPAYALEEFLYEKTDNIETAAYGIETRFWFAGKEIPDLENLEGNLSVSDRTYIEEILFRHGVPVSEYVIQSYVRNALFRKEPDISRIIEQILSPSVSISGQELKVLTEYVFRVYQDFEPNYSFFSDQLMGPIRQRVGELHTAVIELVARLHKGDIDLSWLPKHTFVVLSQIQSHAAGILEDLDDDEAFPEADLEAMDNSLDSMIETYEDIKELIEDSLDSFRRNNISVVKNSWRNGSIPWRTVQLSLSGTGVWRRIIMPGNRRLEELHRIIQILFGWDDRWPHRFTAATHIQKDRVSLDELNVRGFAEVLYEYGAFWTVKIFLSTHVAEEDEKLRCVAGERAPPPSFIEGPLQFRKFLAAVEKKNEPEWRLVRNDEDEKFDLEAFNLEECNQQLEGVLYGRTRTNTND